MKSLGRKTLEQKVRNETDKYLHEEYNKLAYSAISSQIPEVMRQVAAMFLYSLYLHGYRAKRLNDAYEWFVAICNMPPVFGQTPKAQDCMEILTSKYGIDFSKINPHLESYEEFCDGCKK